MAGDKNIFDALQDYEEHYERPLPIKYDLLYFTDEHRKFDALIRRYWHLLHPLSRDLFTSFANEFQYIITLLEENQKKLMEREKDVEELKNSVGTKLEEFENTFENRILEGIANIKNQEFDGIYKENQEFKEQIFHLRREVENKEDLIMNLRNEINLLIDDSDKQAETTKKLEDNIVGSIENFDFVAKQLDTFESELNAAQHAKEEAGQQINYLVSELEEKDSELQMLRESYEVRLRESDIRFNQLKEKIREISPNIEKIHTQSRKVQQENSRLLRELELIKTENEKLLISSQKVNVQDYERIIREKTNLEAEIQNLKIELDSLKVRSFHQQTLLDEHRILGTSKDVENKTMNTVEKVPNQSLPKSIPKSTPVQNLRMQIEKSNYATEKGETVGDLDAIKLASQLPTVPGDDKLMKLTKVLGPSDKSDIKLAIKNSLVTMRKEHEDKTEKNNRDKSESLTG